VANRPQVIEAYLGPQTEGDLVSALLEVAAIVAAYGEVRALWDVSLMVDDGEIVTLLGANGAGKTTTMARAVGVAAPLAGSVTFAGQSIQRLPPPRIVQAGLVQIPEGRRLWPRMTCSRTSSWGRTPRTARQAARDDGLGVFALPPPRRATQAAGRTLSGGEQQMLAIGRGS